MSDLVKDAPMPAQDDGAEPNYTLCWVEKQDRHKFPELQSNSKPQAPANESNQHHVAAPSASAPKPKAEALILREGDDEEDELHNPSPSRRSQPARGTKKPSPNGP